MYDALIAAINGEIALRMIGLAFAAFIVLVCMLIVYKWFWLPCIRINDHETRIERKLLTIEELLINKVSSKRGFELDKELIKLNANPRRELRKVIYDEMLEDWKAKKTNGKA